MNAAPGGELRAAGGLWGPPARALRGMLRRRFPKRHRPTWLSPAADQENSVLIGLLVAGWLTFRVAAPRLSPATTWGPSPANLIDAKRPRGLTRDSRVEVGHGGPSGWQARPSPARSPPPWAPAAAGAALDIGRREAAFRAGQQGWGKEFATVAAQQELHHVGGDWVLAGVFAHQVLAHQKASEGLGSELVEMVQLAGGSGCGGHGNTSS
jgi:hypothetical protein